MTQQPFSIACQGFCSRCNSTHSLPVGNAYSHALALMHQLEKSQRIDFAIPDEQANPALDTKYLWTEARGQMFGVLQYTTQEGTTGILKAFSGQYNGIWQVQGWVPPLLDIDEFYTTTFQEEQKIAALTKQLKALQPQIDETAKTQHENSSLHAEKKRLQNTRRVLSQKLQQIIHGLYRLPNFRGTTLPVPEAFIGNGIPTGTGDCCAPKLLGYAAKNNLTPLGLVEFYWGKENRSQTRQHGHCYPACETKCQPILGHMLCGLHHY